MLSVVEMDFKCFLATGSAKGTGKPCLATKNNGEFFPAGMAWNIAFKADTGHRSEEPSNGKEIVVVSLWSCIVLDHLTSTVHA